MKKYFALLVILMALLVSCKKEDVIPKEDMKKILYDLYFLDYYVENTPEVLFQSDSVFVYEPVFNKYGYTSEDMAAALKYYLSDIETYIAIVKDVRTMLAETEERLSNEENEEDAGEVAEIESSRPLLDETDTTEIKIERRKEEERKVLKKSSRRNERQMEKKKLKELEDKFK